MPETCPDEKRRRPYRRPSVRTFGGLGALTRMALGNRGMGDGGTIFLMRRTGI